MFACVKPDANACLDRSSCELAADSAALAGAGAWAAKPVLLAADPLPGTLVEANVEGVEIT